MPSCMVDMALRPSLRSELDSNANQQADNATTIGVAPLPTEDFSVDCFFDFSEGDCKDGLLQEQEAEELKSQEEEQEEKDSFSESISSQESQDRVDDDNNSNSSGFSDSLFAHELPLPADDLAHLEWLSQFADDSLSEFPVLYVASEERKPENLEKARLEPEPKKDLTDGSSHFPSGVPAKARTKRPRPAVRTWSVGSPLTESSSSSSSTLSCPVPTSTISTIDSSNASGGPPMKKPKKGPAVQRGEMLGSAQFQRRCSHCQVQKTPQWRAGPLGPKTLCNACGVRYKSGRLFPEYRPACSPTFSGDIHSNSHRKVLEIRKRKENAEAELDANYAVPCF